MDEWLWLTNPAVSVAAVFLTWYFGRQNLNSLRADFEREAAKRRVEAACFRSSVRAQLQSLSDGLRRFGGEVREVRDELREVRGELRAAVRESRGA